MSQLVPIASPLPVQLRKCDSIFTESQNGLTDLELTSKLTLFHPLL